MKLRTPLDGCVSLALLVAVGVSGLAFAQNALAQVDNTGYGAGGVLGMNTGSYNTAFGYATLSSNTNADSNQAAGAFALALNTTGAYNSANGAYALANNTTGNYNNASGYQALMSNTTGIQNNAMGGLALSSNTTGGYNNAVGFYALYSNTTGLQNNASGYLSLYSNTGGNYNTGYGAFSLHANTTGTGNNGTGYGALYRSTTGGYNSADGYYALSNNTTGSNNIAIGPYAGSNVTTGSSNIEIGNKGASTDNAIIRIGVQGSNRAAYVAGISGVNVTGGAQVVVNSSGQLGVVSSSRRYKEDIRSMGNTSDRLLALRPVTFRYKQPDEKGQKPEQYGLIAEEVAQVMPELVVYNQKGQPETVAYQTLAPLLVNELQREHKRADQQASELRAARHQLASMQNEINELRRITTELAASHESAPTVVQTEAAVPMPQ